ncbi:hypothetical protein [Rhodococcus opacus]|jgi:hypothetical protein|uniref:hypothetical protein n=1 Tax=Rhodococcus opacus TaxID=37919 RepID=UPI0024741F2F|nr:hypothetical protein [Rhodococcus opacus]MDH6288595.1 hypothetical protein [Rhodococcus opacus]
MDDVTAVPASLSGRSSRRCGRNRINDGVSTTPPTGWKGPVSISSDRGSSRKTEALADRALCPVAVARKFGLGVRKVAAAMRAHDVVGPLDIKTAQRWLSRAEPMPDWFAGLLAQNAARSARRHAKSEAKQVEEEHADLIRSERVYRVLESGKRRRFTESEMLKVRDVALRAAKDLARGASADDLSGGELSALRVVGVDPGNHSTWPLHTSGCDGTGDYCHQLDETRSVRLRHVPGRLA